MMIKIYFETTPVGPICGDPSLRGTELPPTCGPPTSGAAVPVVPTFSTPRRHVLGTGAITLTLGSQLAMLSMRQPSRHEGSVSHPVGCAWMSPIPSMAAVPVIIRQEVLAGGWLLWKRLAL